MLVRSGFEQQHPPPGIGAEPRSEHGSSRAGPDHDYVEGPSHVSVPRGEIGVQR